MTRERDSRNLVPGDIFDGRFQIVDVLGDGSTSTVYLTRQGTSTGDIALKVFKEDAIDLETVQEQLGDTVALVRLMRKSGDQQLARHIVHILDWGIAEGHGRAPFLLMELVSGGDLSKAIRRYACLPGFRGIPLELSLSYLQQILIPLQWMHSRNPPMIHGDLHPHNALLTDSGELKLTDFGLTGRFRSRILWGAIEYQAPESLLQISGETHCDVYAIGLMWYEMLTGHSPFRSKKLAQLRMEVHDLRSEVAALNEMAWRSEQERRSKREACIRKEREYIEEHIKARKEPMPSASEENEELLSHPGLEDALKRCLAFRPEERIHNAVELNMEIEKYLTGRFKRPEQVFVPRIDKRAQPETTLRDQSIDLLREAIRLSQQGDYDRAHWQADEAMRLGANPLAGWLVKARIAIAAGAPENAATFAQRAQHLSPKDPDVLDVLADVYESYGMSDIAREVRIPKPKASPHRDTLEPPSSERRQTTGLETEPPLTYPADNRALFEPPLTYLTYLADHDVLLMKDSDAHPGATFETPERLRAREPLRDHSPEVPTGLRDRGKCSGDRTRASPKGRDEPLACPGCGSTEIRFRHKRGDWFCDACDFRWIDSIEQSQPTTVKRHTDVSFPARSEAREQAPRETEEQARREAEELVAQEAEERQQRDVPLRAAPSVDVPTEPEEESVSLPAPSDPEVIRRHTDVDFPAKVAVGKPHDLRVKIVPAEERLPTGEVVEIPPPHPYDVTIPLVVPESIEPYQPPPPIQVTVSVSAENFDVEGPRTVELTVPLAGDSDELVFCLTGKRAGPGRIMIEFSQENHPVGSVDLLPEVVLDEEQETTGPAPGEGGVSLLTDPGPPIQVKITVYKHRFAGVPGQLQFVVSSTDSRLGDLPVFDAEAGVLDLNSEVATWVKTQLGPLERLAKRSDVIPEDVDRTLRKVGCNLYQQLIPKDLKDLYWTFRERGVRTVLIASDDPHIPWELLRAHRTDPATSKFQEDDLFWGEAFALTHWIRPHPPTQRLSMNRVFAMAPGASHPGAPVQAGATRDLVPDDAASVSQPQSPPPHIGASHLSADEELAVVRKLEVTGSYVTVLPGRRSNLEDALDHGEFDILHLACHGEFGGTATADASAVLMEEDETFTVAELSPLVDWMRHDRPLIFFNACHTGRMGFALTDLGSWGAKFVGLRCGAFVGTLWLVRDESAVVFADAFYERLSRGIPIGEAMLGARHEVRKRFPDDPTWLAYCCYADPMAKIG